MNFIAIVILIALVFELVEPSNLNNLTFPETIVTKHAFDEHNCFHNFDCSRF